MICPQQQALHDPARITRARIPRIARRRRRAAPAAPPVNTAEPAISDDPSRGSCSVFDRIADKHSQPLTFAYQWVRCGADGGRPDGGDCTIISAATGRRYQLVRADVDFRMRVRVTATNAQGTQTVASNPTAAVLGPREPRLSHGPRNPGLGFVVTADPARGAAVRRSRSRIAGFAATRRAATVCRSGARPAARTV